MSTLYINLWFPAEGREQRFKCKLGFVQLYYTISVFEAYARKICDFTSAERFSRLTALWNNFYVFRD